MNICLVKASKIPTNFAQKTFVNSHPGLCILVQPVYFSYLMHIQCTKYGDS